MSARRWMRTESKVARSRVESSTSSVSPALTAAPSFTASSRMMPPSRCCTVRLLPSGLTTPLAIAALASGDTAAQAPKPKTKTPITTPPIRLRRFRPYALRFSVAAVSSSGAGRRGLLRTAGGSGCPGS